jgi:hypothetical protein
MPIIPRERARDATGRVADWASIKEAFVECRLSLPQFTRQHGLSKAAVTKRAGRDRWFAERRRRHPEWCIDWTEVERLYVASVLSVPEFARMHDLSTSALRHRCDRGLWERKRIRRDPADGIRWIEVKTRFVMCHETVRHFAKSVGLRYKTVLRHARREEWEEARLQHNLAIERMHLPAPSE